MGWCRSIGRSFNLTGVSIIIGWVCDPVLWLCGMGRFFLDICHIQYSCGTPCIKKGVEINDRPVHIPQQQQQQPREKEREKKTHNKVEKQRTNAWPT